MKIPSVKSKITHFLELRSLNKDRKFLNKYVTIDKNVPYDAAVQLHDARRLIANYAKAEGVSIHIDAGEQNDVFEHGVGEKVAKRASEGFLYITVNPFKSIKTKRTLTLTAVEDAVSKNVDDIHIYKVDDCIAGNKRIRNVKLEYEDNFLRNIYRKIENAVKELKEANSIN